jgi:hypothetical protein
LKENGFTEGENVAIEYPADAACHRRRGD